MSSSTATLVVTSGSPAIRLANVHGYATSARENKLPAVIRICTTIVGAASRKFSTEESDLRIAISKEIQRCFGMKVWDGDMRIGVLPLGTLAPVCSDENASHEMFALYYSDRKLQGVIDGHILLEHADNGTRELYDLAVQTNLLSHIQGPDSCLACDTKLMIHRGQRKHRLWSIGPTLSVD